MDWAKTCRILASVCLLLLLTLPWGSTQACKCTPRHLQKAYCSDDVVIKAKFVSHSTNTAWKRFEIKTTEVYKGSKGMREFHFLHSRPSTMKGFCGYDVPIRYGEEYIITGMIDKTLVRIDQCAFIQPWAELTPEQRQGISLGYRNGCICLINTCYSRPCTAEAKSVCIWDKSSPSNQGDSLACLPKSGNPGECSWQSLNS